MAETQTVPYDPAKHGPLFARAQLDWKITSKVDLEGFSKADQRWVVEVGSEPVGAIWLTPLDYDDLDHPTICGVDFGVDRLNEISIFVLSTWRGHGHIVEAWRQTVGDADDTIAIIADGNASSKRAAMKAGWEFLFNTGAPCFGCPSTPDDCSVYAPPTAARRIHEAMTPKFSTR